MRVHLDTNILLRMWERTDPLHRQARQAVRTLRGHGVDLCTAPQNVIEFWNVSTRPVGKRSGYNISFEETARRLRLVERMTEVVPDTPPIFETWRSLVMQHRIQGVNVHDARIVAHMQVHNVRHLLTFNARDFRRHGEIVVLDPSVPIPLPLV